MGGGVPGPGQPRALNRLVPEGAVVIDATHSPHGRGALKAWRKEPARWAGGTARWGTARGSTGRTRGDQQFPAADPGQARPGPGRSRAGFKGAEPHSCPWDLAWREVGFPEDPAGTLTPRVRVGKGATPFSFSPSSLLLEGDPCPTHAQRGN